jgi:predicted ABC-type ATPase
MLKYIDKNKCDYSISNTIVKKYIDRVTKPLQSQDNPLCIINVGGPGSGKTTVSKMYVKKILKENVKDFCIIDPDIILYKYFENDINCYEIDNNSPYKVVNELFSVAVKNKYHILYDTTGLNINDIKKKISLLIKQNYTINVCITIIDDISIALQRIKERRNRTGRNIDLVYLYKRYKDLPKTLESFYLKSYKNKFNQIIIFNTSGSKPVIQYIYN